MCLVTCVDTCLDTCLHACLDTCLDTCLQTRIRKIHSFSGQVRFFWGTINLQDVFKQPAHVVCDLLKQGRVQQSEHPRDLEDP